MVTIQELATLLRSTPVGRVPAETRVVVLKMLGACWTEFAGSAASQMVSARHARVGFLRLSNVVPINGREHRTEPGTASRTAETKGPKMPPSDFTFLQRPHVAAFNPANPPGFGPFVTALETLGTNRTAWWRREDSNCVPGT